MDAEKGVGEACRAPTGNRLTDLLWGLIFNTTVSVIGAITAIV